MTKFFGLNNVKILNDQGEEQPLQMKISTAPDPDADFDLDETELKAVAVGFLCLTLHSRQFGSLWAFFYRRCLS